MNNKLKAAIGVLCVVLAAGAVIPSFFVMKYNSEIKSKREQFEINAFDNKNKNEDRIHFLSTGSSDAILLESNGRFALIDCAEDSDNPRGFEELAYEGCEERVLEYLKANAADKNGIVKLDFILGTHSHSDHIGGFDTIIADSSVKIGKAYLKEYNESQIISKEVDEWDNKEVYEQMINALNFKNIPIISDIDDQPFSFGNFTVTFFNTKDNNPEKVGENDNSVGVLVEKNGARIFLAGDINNVNGDEDRLAPLIGKVDLLKVGHHSYSGSTTSKWLKILSPEVCVVTNNYESADKRTLRRITRVSNSVILLTGQENGIVAVIDDDGKISYYNNIH